MATKSKRTTKTRESILRVESSTDEVKYGQLLNLL